MITFVIFKVVVKGRKILGVEEIDRITKTFKECCEECVSKGYAVWNLKGDNVSPKSRIEIRTV